MESYVECMVAQKTPGYKLFIKYLLIGLTIVAALAMFVFGTLAFIAAIILGVGAYFYSMHVDVEFEYLYIDKEIVVDRIFHKAKRKRFATYSVDKIEIMAPIKSYHLDDYKNRQVKVFDISSAEEKQPDLRYVFFYEGAQKIIFEPNEAFVKAVKNVSPRKTFLD